MKIHINNSKQINLHYISHLQKSLHYFLSNYFYNLLEVVTTTKQSTENKNTTHILLHSSQETIRGSGKKQSALILNFSCLSK